MSTHATRRCGLGSIVARGLLGVSAAGGAALSTSTSLAAPPAAAATAVTPSIQEAYPAAYDLSVAFERIANSIGPSVVSIEATRTVRMTQSAGNLPPEMQEFFERFGGPSVPGFGGGDQPDREFRQGGEGSGFVVRSDGYIVTNNHVIDGADEVAVVFTDGSRATAEVIGTDPGSDIAVIKVDRTDLESVSFADADDLRVGQWVVAAGNPFGLSSTITAGIVSATNRRTLGITGYEDFIQTDAAINPGNSGGPLVDLNGDVVGINTAILSRNGGNQGIGLAIPVRIAGPVVESLITSGSVTRGYIGIGGGDLNDGLARSFGFRGTEGVVVNNVPEGDPADRAGLEVGDIITEINDQPTPNFAELRLIAAELKPGDTAALTVFREGRERVIELTVAPRPDAARAAGAGETRPGAPIEMEKVGIEVTTITPEVRTQFRMPDTINGVVIARVDPSSPAGRNGLRPGQIVRRIGDATIETMDDFNEAMKDADLSDGIRMLIQQGNARQFVWLESDD